MSGNGSSRLQSCRSASAQITSFAAIQISPGSGHSPRWKRRAFAAAGNDLFQPAGEQILSIPFRLDFSIPELLYEFEKEPIVLSFAASHTQTNADLWLFHFD